MKQSKIKGIILCESDTHRNSDFPEQLTGLHLRYVERTMNELGLNDQEKMEVLNGIAANLRLQSDRARK